MQPCYCIIDGQSNEQIPASIREATATDFERTAREHWQTDWRTDFIQDTTLEKYALELDATKELVGLAAYRDMPEGVLVYVEYMESAPSGNPTLSKTRKYAGIGAALLAFGIQLPIDYGYGGAIYLKEKQHSFANTICEIMAQSHSAGLNRSCCCLTAMLSGSCSGNI